MEYKTTGIESLWHNLFIQDFGADLARTRPTPILWHMYYLQNLNLRSERGKKFADKVKKLNIELLEETMTTLQELVLDGDHETTKFQIGRERNRNKDFRLNKQNTLIQFAVLNGDDKMVKMLLDEERQELKLNNDKEFHSLVNKGDLVTGFTPFHFAMFVENVEMMRLLIREGADVHQKDNFFASPFDYARMLGFTNYNPYPMLKTLAVWNAARCQIEYWPIKTVEAELGIKFSPRITCNHDYIEELMFSGFMIHSPDIEFRNKYLPLVYASSGDENLILGQVNENVGFGVFAGRDFKEGEYIVRLDNAFVDFAIDQADKIQDKSYAMASGLEAMMIDAKFERNFGGMINHSSNPNAECQCVFDKGVEQAMVTAKCNIKKGEQILINYSKNYWTKSTLKTHKLETLNQLYLPL